ncbi:N-methylhydantoinase B [Halospina denitrificans]|uniref:N-methylhydantoinase B n=1 Tax=Halospina denitrificans TaxID=332522 RepID=A0A4R7JP14_9GAMM|nr:hydantoinase B/oxoprolinase family protein [Halospina denitrificans]TDT38479.1 N-methylhydantoinase B [Halospina denitrificans]
MDAIELSLFVSRLTAICDDMGAVLRRASLSPNIKDRMDFSCAIFDAHGELCAQAAHIPVHLGSMAYAMADIVSRFEWEPGDVVILNDPFLGGTHLPDITLVAPVFSEGALLGFAANRAHHASIGASAPGSMPLSTRLEEEGIVIAPARLVAAGERVTAMVNRLGAIEPGVPEGTLPGDFEAQLSAVTLGVQRLSVMVGQQGRAPFSEGLGAMNDYAARLAAKALEGFPDGQWHFTDSMDSDGAGATDIAIQGTLTIDSGRWHLSFDGTSEQVEGNINCPLSVTAAAAYYSLRCLLPAQIPDCAGAFSVLSLSAPEGSLVNARGPAAVAAGNVETSSRIVDVCLGILAQVIPERIPAASQGTMNNLAIGSRAAGNEWHYYETIGGGGGGHAAGSGLNGVHTHMTNTRNTPIESLELHYPMRLWSYRLRRGSGGQGRNRGGDGVVRDYEFLAPAEVTLLTERRRRGPWGVAGGEAGAAGENLFNGEPLTGKARLLVEAGDRLSIASPGGGGWGRKDPVQ